METQTISITKINGEVIFTHTQENNNIKITLKKALENDCSLIGVNLFNADLSDIDLQGATLDYANLTGANLRNAKLDGASLSNAIMNRINISDTSMRFTNLNGAEMRSVSVFRTDFHGSILKYMIIFDSYFEDCNFRDCSTHYTYFIGSNFINSDFKGIIYKHVYFINSNLSSSVNVPNLPMACPSEGSFIGWKKVKAVNDEIDCRFVESDYNLLCYYENVLIKLLIPEDAKRISATSLKCRCDKAKVLSIQSIDTGKMYDKVYNSAWKNFEYKVGEMVYPDSFDDNRYDECSHGIHFFINKQDAIDY